MTTSFVAPDGSPLALYLALPPGDAPSVIHEAIPDGCSILELGSGPGRLTRVLVALGHSVTAVDDSAEMLEHVTGADTIVGDLFDLDLGRRFGVVLVASHLVNVPGEQKRDRLLTVCRRHLARGGSVIVERHAPGWLLACEAQASAAGPVTMRFTPGELDGEVRTASMTYTLAGRTWTQDFRAEDVDDAKLAESAATAGLAIERVLDDDGRWVLLRAVRATQRP